MFLHNDKNYPEPTGEECRYCDGLGLHKKDKSKAVVCGGKPPYCTMCRNNNGDCPYCHGTGLERTH